MQDSYEPGAGLGRPGPARSLTPASSSTEEERHQPGRAAESFKSMLVGGGAGGGAGGGELLARLETAISRGDHK